MVSVCHAPTLILTTRLALSVMGRYRLTTKREAINFALRTLAAEPLGLDEARNLRGAGLGR